VKKGSHQGHGHGHRHGQYGNPADLASYVARLDDPDRARWQKPARVIAAAGVREGHVVCEVGGGTGYFALRLARAVGPAGHVYAVDTEARLLEVLRDRVAAARARNVSPILALPSDPLIPDVSCHRILIVAAYHHFADGVAMLRALCRKLRRGGRLVNVDFREGELPVGPPPDHKVTRAEFLRDARRAGLELVREETFLPYQYLLVLAPSRLS
jgi:ubiquinone/menaquinone biosynthesis C-methylase UbiE